LPLLIKGMVVVPISTHRGMCLVNEVATHYKKIIQKTIKGECDLAKHVINEKMYQMIKAKWDRQIQYLRSWRYNC
jgi:hypothetical protein